MPTTRACPAPFVPLRLGVSADLAGSAGLVGGRELAAACRQQPGNTFVHSLHSSAAATWQHTQHQHQHLLTRLPLTPLPPSAVTEFQCDYPHLGGTGRCVECNVASRANDNDCAFLISHPYPGAETVPTIDPAYTYCGADNVCTTPPQ